MVVSSPAAHLAAFVGDAAVPRPNRESDTSDRQADLNPAIYREDFALAHLALTETPDGAIAHSRQRVPGTER